MLEKRKGDKKLLPLHAKIEIFGALMVALVIGISLTSTNLINITGFTPVEIFTQDLDLQVPNSQVYKLEGSGGSFSVTSFRLSGEVIGTGGVEVLLDDGNNHVVVFKNVVNLKQGSSPLTGFSAAEDTEANSPGNFLKLAPAGAYEEEWQFGISANQGKVEGPFSNSCEESCFVSIDMSAGNEYTLIFRVEEDTKLHVESITYNIEEN